jgi:hypothetical protein
MQNSPESVILSTAYFPPIEYFAHIVSADDVLIEKHENYSKQSYRNRCNILSANGLLPLIIPVKKKSTAKTIIKDIKPDYSYKWQRLHRISLESAYRSAPFYEYYMDDIMPFFESRYTYLIDLNAAILDKFLEILYIKKRWNYTENFINEPQPGHADKRDSVHPKRKTAEMDLIAREVIYRQVFEDKTGFVPGLSVLDLVFNTGPDAAGLLNHAASVIHTSGFLPG